MAVARQAARNLAGAVGAKVEIDADVAVANGAYGFAATVSYDKGNDELIGNAAVVRLFDALHWIGIPAAFSVAVDHSVESFPLAVPFLVAVHGVITSADRGDLADTVLAHLLLQLFHVHRAVGRKRIAPVHESVDENALDAVLFR